MLPVLSVLLVNSYRVDRGMEMKVNQAYNPVSSTHPATEEAYDYVVNPYI